MILKLLKINKTRNGWEYEYRLGRLRCFGLLDKTFTKEKLIPILATKFNVNQDVILNVMSKN